MAKSTSATSRSPALLVKSRAARTATHQHYSEYAERTIRGLQRQGLIDKKLNPRITADALGAMVGRFAELWLVEGYGKHDFDEVVDQLTMLCVNALGVPDEP